MTEQTEAKPVPGPGSVGTSDDPETTESVGEPGVSGGAGQVEVVEPVGAVEERHPPTETGHADQADQAERTEPGDVVPLDRAAEPSAPVSEPEAVAAAEAVSAPTPPSGPVAEPEPARAPVSGAAPESAPGLAPAPPPAQVLESGAPHPTAPTTPKNHRHLRATLRWTAALLTFALFGAGTAYGIAGMERTDVPGLGTVSDGRWVFPVLRKAPLPAGKPGPLDAGNKAGSHYADLRALVLPAPEGATADPALRGTDGWLPVKDYLREYAEKEDRDELGTKLSENGLRHIAARGWTTPDGTHTRIYLMQFDTAAVVDDLFGRDLAPYGSPGYELRDATASVSDEHFPDAARIQDITASVYVEPKPYGTEQTRHAYISSGDVLALVVQSRKGAANPVPFQQTVTLQSQLLG